MDRREALKKLGLGGAVAVTGPILLQSYAVAAGASSMPSAATVNAAMSYTTGTKTVTLVSFSPSPFPAGTTFVWTTNLAAGLITTTVTFSPLPANTLLTSMTVATGLLSNKTFSANLAATHPLGDTVNYTFYWNSSTLVVQ